jgi:hypothetical protein
LLEIGVGAIEEFVDSIQDGFVTVEVSGTGLGAAGGVGHISILSRLDGAVPRGFFSVDFFEGAQFGRAPWCQGFWRKIFKRRILECKIASLTVSISGRGDGSN